MTAFSPLSLPAAHWPMASPARQLSVAKVMSTTSGGSVGVSRAITYNPASRACSIALLTLTDIGVIRIPSWPAAMAFSIEVDLTLVVAFGLSGSDRQVDPELVGLLPRTFLHGHEEGVGRVLGDQ